MFDKQRKYLLQCKQSRQLDPIINLETDRSHLLPRPVVNITNVAWIEQAFSLPYKNRLQLTRRSIFPTTSIYNFRNTTLFFTTISDNGI